MKNGVDVLCEARAEVRVPDVTCHDLHGITTIDVFEPPPVIE
jgi:hypothetical protein